MRFSIIVLKEPGSTSSLSSFRDVIVHTVSITKVGIGVKLKSLGFLVFGVMYDISKLLVYIPSLL